MPLTATAVHNAKPRANSHEMGDSQGLFPVGGAFMRASIAETQRLVGESDKMLKRHRQERESEDAEEEDLTAKQPPSAPRN